MVSVSLRGDDRLESDKFHHLLKVLCSGSFDEEAELLRRGVAFELSAQWALSRRTSHWLCVTTMSKLGRRQTSHMKD
eukprot:scaffold215_cov389-Pavlova_lutheri.AAC.10